MGAHIKKVHAYNFENHSFSDVSAYASRCNKSVAVYFS